MESVRRRPPLLDRAYTLADGHRVRLRLARSSDARAIRDLAARRRFEAHPFEVDRLTRFDPWRRLVVAATSLIDSRETFVGVGAIDLDGPEPFEPDTLIFDDRLDGLGHLLADVLIGWARSVAGRRAA
jgi:hypothetical protein